MRWVSSPPFLGRENEIQRVEVTWPMWMNLQPSGTEPHTLLSLEPSARCPPTPSMTSPFLISQSESSTHQDWALVPFSREASIPLYNCPFLRSILLIVNYSFTREILVQSLPCSKHCARAQGLYFIYKVDAVSSPRDTETEMINNQIHI